MNEQQESPIENELDTSRIDTATVSNDAAASPSNPHVDALAYDIGPRPPGSINEGRAADYLISALKQVGLPAARMAAQIGRAHV